MLVTASMLIPCITKSSFYDKAENIALKYADKNKDKNKNKSLTREDVLNFFNDDNSLYDILPDEKIVVLERFKKAYSAIDSRDFETAANECVCIDILIAACMRTLSCTEA